MNNIFSLLYSFASRVLNLFLYCCLFFGWILIFQRLENFKCEFSSFFSSPIWILDAFFFLWLRRVSSLNFIFIFLFNFFFLDLLSFFFFIRYQFYSLTAELKKRRRAEKNYSPVNQTYQSNFWEILSFFFFVEFFKFFSLGSVFHRRWKNPFSSSSAWILFRFQFFLSPTSFAPPSDEQLKYWQLRNYCRIELIIY